MNVRYCAWMVGVATTFGCSTLVGFVCAQATSNLASPSREDGSSVFGGEPSASATKPVDVVLAGSVAASSELSGLIEELLLAASVVPRFLRVAGMDRTQLLDAAAEASSGRARIWVMLSDPDRALLLFAGPSREQYLVRQVALRNGFDELGRERVAHVIQSATLALLRGATEMTHAQMRVAVARANQAPEVEAGEDTQNAKSLPRTSPPQTAPPARQPVAVDGSHRHPIAVPLLGLGYVANWSGHAIGLGHGPLVRFGLDRIDGTVLSVGLLLERYFAQQYQTSEVGLELQTTLFRLLLGAKLPLGASMGFYSAIGGGLDFNRVSPLAPSASTVALRSDATYTTFAACLDTGLELELGSLLLDLGPRVDVSLRDTHYDLVRNEIAERLVTPWSVVPGFSISAALRPWVPK